MKTINQPIAAKNIWVKIFSSNNHTTLENDVNNWLRNASEVTVVYDILYQHQKIGQGMADEVFSALMLYRPHPI